MSFFVQGVMRRCGRAMGAGMPHMVKAPKFYGRTITSPPSVCISTETRPYSPPNQKTPYLTFRAHPIVGGSTMCDCSLA
jgi:hypothetical protein